MQIPDSVFLISGYVLAHAAYSVCDADEGELLIPLAVVESDGRREVLRFEADSQEEAIARAKGELTALKQGADIWAFAREGLWQPDDGPKQDVFAVTAWAKGVEMDVSIIQPFRPNRGIEDFRLLAGLDVVIDGDLLDGEIAQTCRAMVEEGVTYHPRGGQWASWH